jgi:hypothetical protein
MLAVSLGLDQNLYLNTDALTIIHESLHQTVQLARQKPPGFTLMILTDKFKDMKDLSNSTSGS